MTQVTLSLANLETLIQQSQEYAGLLCRGQVILSMIKLQLNSRIIATIHTDSCARNSDTVLITVENQTPSPANPNSQSPSSKISSLSISKHSLLISPGRDGWTINYEDLVTWLHSQDVSDGSSADVMILPFYGRQLLMTLKAPSPT